MNKFLKCSIFLLYSVCAVDDTVIVVPEAASAVPVPPATKLNREKLITFNYDNVDVSAVINDLAGYKGINIILPQGVAAINQKVSIKFSKKIPLSQAENIVNYILDLIGYAMYPNDSFYVIKKMEGIQREPLRLFINVLPEDLPIGERIRAIFYLANLKVPDQSFDMNQNYNKSGVSDNNPINIFLSQQLTPGAFYMFDPKSNGIIIEDRGDVIASVMEAILRLDSSGSRETIDIVPLYNSSANIVANLLQQKLLGISPENKGIIRSDVKSESALYFSSNTRVVADPRTNSLILLGKETALTRLRDFIQEYLDAPPDSGRSILHVYDLQYLDAESFAATLQEILKARGIGAGTGQAGVEATGPHHFFEGVIVQAETYKAAPAAKTLPGTAATQSQEPTEESQVYTGGNRLIITALHKDWARIKDLIQELDKPQLQVILEVMVCDLTAIDNKQLASQLRNPAGLQLPAGFNFQAANITGIIADQPTPVTPNAPPTTVAADLLKLLVSTTGGNPTSIAVPQSSPPLTGATILSVNDPSQNGSGIWCLLDFLSAYAETKILSHPFLVTLNNVKATQLSSDIRRAVGDQSVGEGAVSTIKQEDVTAAFSLNITPRISSEDRVNLQINLEITDFTSLLSTNSQDFTRISRRLQTNANLGTGQILVLGGLTRVDVTEAINETPILGQIPIIGWFFRGNSYFTTKTNLAVFICPTIVNPKLTAGMKKYTNNKIKRGYDTITADQLFDNLKDPITRWFFAPQNDADKEIFEEYLQEVTTVHQNDEPLVKRIEAIAPLAPEQATQASDAIEEKYFKEILATAQNPFQETIVS